MANKSGRLGTEAENAVRDVFIRNGFPHCERRRLSGAHDKGDLSGVLGICVEIKGGNAAKDASDATIRRWLVETEVERVNARADFGLLVVKRRPYGDARADEWWAVMRISDLAALLQVDSFYLGPVADKPVRLTLDVAITLLRLAGYGDSLTTESETAA